MSRVGKYYINNTAVPSALPHPQRKQSRERDWSSCARIQSQTHQQLPKKGKLRINTCLVIA